MKRWFLALVGFVVISAGAYLLTTVLSTATTTPNTGYTPVNVESPVGPTASTPARRAITSKVGVEASPVDQRQQRGLEHERSPGVVASRQAELEHHIRRAGEPSSPEPVSIPRDPAQDRAALGKKEIQAAIRAVTPLVKECYEKRLKENQELQGKSVVKFTIIAKDGEGSIDEGEIKSSTLEDLRLDTCILHALTKARFPLPRDEGKVSVTYPFTFRRAGK